MFGTGAGMPFFYGLDPLYFIVFGGAMILSLIAQAKVSSAFKKYSAVRNSRNLSGAEAAQRMLQSVGVNDVQINRYQGGMLSDHYNPATKIINLSPEVHDGRNIAAVGVACHEAGHALQHAQGYPFLKLRTLLVPTASLGSKLGIPLIVIGAAMGMMGLAKAGLVLFGLVFLFQVITLPVELDASARSKRTLLETGMVTGEEGRGVAAVLNAAAFTYIAAAISSLMTLLYYAFRLGLLGGRRSQE